ncbi:MAG TPA: imidazole glycerol phosphate synthase subunit HisH [Planctomycetaceae bacterium]|jgi:glutamine amidotransferase|nr:imidazole glycerol phosphate synthase subunit HisH [Planctomycetaceae bacterium]
MIKIVDYGMGNLRSVQKAFEKLGSEAVICARPTELAGAEKLILPGVGAFRDAIHELRRTGLDTPVREHIASGRPFLGICLGLQLLFDVSYEDGQWEGLGVLPGKIVRFQDQPDLKIPHMGWNTLDIVRPHRLFEGIANGSSVYFVHSYYVVPNDDSVVAARSEHGGPFAAAVARENLFATQFHPEKSQTVGLRLLKNFAAL